MPMIRRPFGFLLPNGHVGYVANSVCQANGTMSAARVYDRVGDLFWVEVCFPAVKIICQITDFDVPKSRRDASPARPQI